MKCLALGLINDANYDDWPGGQRERGWVEWVLEAAGC